ncbi:MAG: response regulator [Thermoanaerobacterales bacterium]|nr:response regulator [Bacillota bacterium]MDI6905969.1 response regulator [Thermoanaerobacterales bacterium]
MERPKVLIVDDQQSSLTLLKAQLQEYDVIEAGSGRQALKKIAEEKPDLILLDVMMPGMDGHSVLSIVRNAEETRLTPVLLVTALSDPEEKVKSLEKGADDYITKPFNPLELRARIKSLLRIKTLQTELENACNTLISIALVLEARDTYSVDHSRRTAFYAEMLAHKIFPGIKPAHRQMRMAGLLHDIGRVAIKDGVLSKPGKLDPEEFEIVKRHPVAGERICSHVSSLKPILPIIRHHHENFDGSGYPDGLAGREIPFGARILAIADAFDALTTDRPYRQAFERQTALEILQKGAGSQWDPRLVEQFIELAVNGALAEEKMAAFFAKHNYPSALSFKP